MPRISIPNNWDPRHYQQELWDYLEAGGRRACVVCHRRWGKDDVALHYAATHLHKRVANGWHMLPHYAQARKAVWNAVNAHTGKRRIDEAFPKALRKRTNEQEMFIEFKNGSTWQLIGSDNYNALVGSPPALVTFSEWALANPSAWAYLSPILMENDGTALFLYTPRGMNHGFSLYENARQNSDWLALRQSASETGIFTEAQLKAAMAEYVALYGEEEGESLYEQEYNVSFEAAILGSYYGRLIARLEKDDRICSVPHDPALPVYTAWDLGIHDSTAVWFAQIAGREIRIIDYYEISGQSLSDTAKVLLNQRPYTYADHYLPHDVEIREMTSGQSRRRTLENLGLRPIRPGARLPVADGINAVRNLLPKCVFDTKKCAKGLNALRQYRRDYDAKNQVYRQQPVHDWASHGADAFRELAVNLYDRRGNASQQPYAITDYDVFNLPSGREVGGGSVDYDPYSYGMDYDPFKY